MLNTETITIKEKETKTFRFSIADLEISFQDIDDLAPMGEGMSMYEEMLAIEIEKLKKTASIEGGFRILEAGESEKEAIKVADKGFETGKSIRTYLKNSEYYALFICTAGEEVSARSKELMGKGDLLEGYLVDVLGSVMVEKAMDKIQTSLKEEMATLNLECTNRYSPGYCNWNVSEQVKLFSFFPENFCGISLSDSCLMHPVKSVSGIIGIGKEVKHRGHACDQCNSTNCIYRAVRQAQGS